MAPRLPISYVYRCRAVAGKQPIDPVSSLISLFACFSIQTRHASILASLSNVKAAYNKRKRIGRGPSSGYGKTAGRGHKGQGQHGKVKPWFQGGQTPLIVQRGQKGFENTYVGRTRMTSILSLMP
jgi:Ribosomal proteins 50S-L15, 50S-L18e, 60S-L27A